MFCVCFRLFREAKHPKIVEVIECISIQNQLAIVMEFMAGGNLKVLLDKNQGRGQGKEFTVRFTEDIGSALEHLHSLNIIHRDVKPENIFVRTFNLPFGFCFCDCVSPIISLSKYRNDDKMSAGKLTSYCLSLSVYLQLQFTMVVLKSGKVMGNNLRWNVALHLVAWGNK